MTTNGVFTIKLASASGSQTVTGWSSADGNVIIIGGASKTTKTSGAVDFEVKKTFGVKAGAVMDVTSLQGVFDLVSSNVGFLDSSGSGGPVDLKGQNIAITFDGGGNCSVSAQGAEYAAQNFYSTSVTNNTDSSAVQSSACAYTVDPTGSFTLNFTMVGSSEVNTVTGYASADGMAVVIGEKGNKQTDDTLYTKYYSKLVYGVKTSAVTVY